MFDTIYVKNKYSILYFSIITKAQKQFRCKKDGNYYEHHHIYPKSLGGSNDGDNLVLLTAKEHYVCHHLLIKFTTGGDYNKMLNAFWLLTHISNQKITCSYC